MVADRPHPDSPPPDDPEDKPEAYDPQESSGTEHTPDEGAARTPARKPSEEFGPLDLEEPEPAASHAETLDVCPNCGAPMEGIDTLVCLRCGFDLKTLRVIESAVVESEVDEEEDESARAEPLVKPMLADPLMPSLLAVLSIGTIAVALLAGLEALFPAFDPETADTLKVPWRMRLDEALRLPVFIGIWVACGFSALLVGGWLFGRPLGDASLAALRMLAVVSIAHLAVFFDITNPNMELFLEALLHGIAFFLLIMVLYRLKPRDTATVLGVMVVMYVLLSVLSRVVAWATG